MKVCFVSHSSRNGGAERSLVETIRVLLARNVACVALLPAVGPLSDALDRMGVVYRVLPYKKWAATEGGALWRRLARPLWSLMLAPFAALWIRRQGADLVYTNTIVIGVGAVAAALAGRAHVWHIRELGYEHNRMVFDLGERLSLSLIRRLSKLCLANSSCVADKYRAAIRPTEIRVVYQGVRLDESTVEPRSEDGARLVVVGSISKQKRQEEAIEAVVRLGEQGLRAQLLVIGEGDRSYERELRELAAQRNAGDRVCFMGALESAGGVIRSADVVVNCSRGEAFGRVTVEGMLAGKPVVGARSAGTAELIRDGENGLLYEPGDVEQLTEILRWLIENPQAAARLGAAARTWASRRFTDGRFGDELLACLRPLAPAGRS